MYLGIGTCRQYYFLTSKHILIFILARRLCWVFRQRQFSLRILLALMPFKHACVCLCVQVCVYVGVYTGMWRLQDSISLSLEMLSTSFETRSLTSLELANQSVSLSVCLSVWLDSTEMLLPSPPPPRDGITSMGHHAQYSHLGLGKWTQILVLTRPSFIIVPFPPACIL